MKKIPLPPAHVRTDVIEQLKRLKFGREAVGSLLISSIAKHSQADADHIASKEIKANAKAKHEKEKTANEGYKESTELYHRAIVKSADCNKAKDALHGLLRGSPLADILPIDRWARCANGGVPVVIDGNIVPEMPEVMDIHRQWSCVDRLVNEGQSKNSPPLLTAKSTRDTIRRITDDVVAEIKEALEKIAQAKKKNRRKPGPNAKVKARKDKRIKYWRVEKDLPIKETADKLEAEGFGKVSRSTISAVAGGKR